MHFKTEFYLNRGVEKEFSMRLEDPDHPDLALRFSNVSDENNKQCGNCLCTVLTEFTPSPEIGELLQNLPERWPKNLHDFKQELSRRLHDAPTKALHLLDWFRGGFNDYRIAGSKGLAYSLDGSNWKTLQSRAVSIHLGRGVLTLTMTEKVATSVSELWRKGTEPPFAQELFREAFEQESQNPRSCLVIAVAAVEVGFKELVGSLAPDAKWLVDNVPSPPLHKMLRKYLPELRTKALPKEAKAFVPAKLITLIEDAVEMRNSVVHSKPPKIPSEKLRDILLAIHDCLYLFAFYNGQAWALDRVTMETKAQMAKETSNYSRPSQQPKPKH
jgi:hypothetical protein